MVHAADESHRCDGYPKLQWEVGTVGCISRADQPTPSHGQWWGARVVKVDGIDGKIIRDFNDPNATYISFVTSAVEFEGNLYLASLQSYFIGKLPLDAPNPELATI